MGWSRRGFRAAYLIYALLAGALLGLALLSLFTAGAALIQAAFQAP